MGDYANTKLPSIVTAEHVKAMNTVEGNYIIDIRTSADFVNGHIENAVNVPAADVLDHLEGTTGDDGKDIHIVCYTGQTSCWLTTLLRLAGYDNTYSMKFGMCAWHEDFASIWNANIGSQYSAHFTSDPASKAEQGDLPLLNTGYTSGAEILQARIQALLSEGFGPARITSAEAFEGREYFYIVNYFPESDYTDLGHIPGAVQYTPRESMRLDSDLTTLPTDRPVVIYGWTGQASAALVAYLRVIGYDAQSLLFGVNGMIYDELESNKWNDAMIMGYDYVTE
jgi:rhodanese-related sulfurtransferase